ncbi:hypothetical protein [Streptomyces sp. cmx-4-9]|uniref:hypothetical protein n=1 Tax=Streptomyces sp. cmx-4-9 TaxID=2790941 RepID=UPI003980C5C3
MARRGHPGTSGGALPGPPAVPGPEIAAAADRGAQAAGWLFLGRDGRLTAYAGCAGGVVRWTESAPGSDRWHGPELFPVEGWGGRFALAQDGDGFVWFAGARRREGASGGHEFVVAAQYQTGRPLGEWRTVGNPFPAQEGEAAEPVGPVVLPDGAGSLHVVVSRFGTGVCGRTRRDDGTWEDWTDYRGQWVRGPVVPLVTSRGRAEFLAPFRGGATYWSQDRPGSPFRWLGRMEAEAVEGSYTCLRTGPDTGTYFWRHPADGSVVAYRPAAPAGPGPHLMPLGGAGGSGPVDAVRTGINGTDCTVLLQRGAEGYPEIAAYPTHGEQYGAWWAPVGDRCAGLPALALDAYGSVAIAMVDTDGRLRVCRQDLTEPGLTFGAWRTVG